MKKLSTLFKAFLSFFRHLKGSRPTYPSQKACSSLESGPSKESRLVYSFKKMAYFYKAVLLKKAVFLRKTIFLKKTVLLRKSILSAKARISSSLSKNLRFLSTPPP